MHDGCAARMEHRGNRKLLEVSEKAQERGASATRATHLITAQNKARQQSAAGTAIEDRQVGLNVGECLSSLALAILYDCTMMSL